MEVIIIRTSGNTSNTAKILMEKLAEGFEIISAVAIRDGVEYIITKGTVSI